MKKQVVITRGFADSGGARAEIGAVDVTLIDRRTITSSSRCSTSAPVPGAGRSLPPCGASSGARRTRAFCSGSVDVDRPHGTCVGGRRRFPYDA